MKESDIPAVVSLIVSAMSPTKGQLAHATIKKHFELRRLGADDGRRYLALASPSGVIGITGLHHYEWGPPKNVWLGWFAILPEMQRQGFGTMLLTQMQEHARTLGFEKLLIETYSSPEFSDARLFYEKKGFHQVGGIAGYVSENVDLVVFAKLLTP